MTLLLPIYISISNLVQIDQELADICRFVIFQDGGRRHLGFVIRRFWTIHHVPVAGFYVTCQWRIDQLEFIRDIMILPFRDFGCKLPIPANFGGFGRL